MAYTLTRADRPQQGPLSGRGSGASLLFLMRIALFPAVLALLAGCGSTPPSPEVQLRSVLEAGESAVEARDLAAAMKLVDSDYRGADQQDWRQLRAMLAGYFFRHPSIYVISQIDRIEIIRPGRAHVVLFAGLAGSAQEAAGPLSGWRGNLLRLDLEFTLHDEEEWRLMSAAWRPATREDFTAG